MKPMPPMDPDMDADTDIPGDPADTDMDADAGAEIDAMGAMRRAEIAKQATNGADVNALPKDVQDALVAAAGEFAKATGTEHVLQGGLEDAVALVASAHNSLQDLGSPFAEQVDPALLMDPNTAGMVIDALSQIAQDPETLEALAAGPGGAPPEAEMPVEEDEGIAPVSFEPPEA